MERSRIDEPRGPATRRPEPAEAEAVAAARALIRARGAEGRHHVAASVLTADGRRFTALNLESTLGQAAACAEPGALSMALSAEPAGAPVVFVAAVNRRGEVIPPCGLCRELLLDHAPLAAVAVPDDGDFAVTRLAQLIPMPYKAGRRVSDGTRPGAPRGGRATG